MTAFDGSLVIVGGGPAGLATARAYREAGGRAEVRLITDEPHLPYRRPPLSKEYLRTGEEREELWLESAAWLSEHRIELVHGTAVRLDPDAGTVMLGDGGELAWGACVLATGSEPVVPELPGAGLEAVLTLRTLGDADEIRRRVASGVRRVVVTGSGFIGCELAASLHALGCEVVVLSGEDVPQEKRLGRPVGARIAGWLEELGVELRLGVQVTAIELVSSTGVAVHGDDDGALIAADLVVLAVGARPRLELAREAGLQLAPDGTGVACDSALRTSHPRVLAVGDIAHAHHPLAGRSLRVEHWGDALAHGAAAGCTLAGVPSRWESVPGFWSTIGERTLKLVAWQDGWDTERLVAHPGGGFTVYYGRDGTCVGVLTHEADEDCERGEKLVAEGRPVPDP